MEDLIAIAIVIALVVFIGPVFILPLIIYWICRIPNIRNWVKFILLLLVTLAYIPFGLYEFEGWWSIVEYSTLPITICVIFFSNNKRAQFQFVNSQATPVSSIKLINACFICQYFLLIEFLQRIFNEGRRLSIYYSLFHPVNYESPWEYSSYIYGYPNNSIILIIPVIVSVVCIVWMHIQLNRKRSIPSSSKNAIKSFGIDLSILMVSYLILFIPLQVWNYYPKNYRIIYNDYYNYSQFEAECPHAKISPWFYETTNLELDNSLSEAEIDYLMSNTNIVLYPQNKKTIGNICLFEGKKAVDDELGKLISDLGADNSSCRAPELFNEKIKEFQCGFSDQGLVILNIMFVGSNINGNHSNPEDYEGDDAYAYEKSNLISSLDQKYLRLPLQAFGAMYWTDGEKIIRLRHTNEKSLSYISHAALLYQKKEYLGREREAENKRLLEELRRLEEIRRDSLENLQRQRRLDSINQQKIKTSNTVL